MKFRRPSPGLAISIVALVVAMSGSAVAASLITSAQIKNGTIQVKDLSRAAQKSLKGKKGSPGTQGIQGIQGIQGVPGATGPSDAFSFFHDAPVSLPNTSTPLSVPLGPGNYVIFAKLEVNNNSAVTARPDCTLTAGTDTDDALLGTSENATNDDTASGTLTVTHTFASAGAVTLGCDDGGAGANMITVEKVKITAIRVGTLANTAF